MSRDDPDWSEFAEFVRSRPPSVQALMRRFPPDATVKTVPGVILLIPAPGVEGGITSYFEDGFVGVTAPMSIPHPEHGWGPPGRELEVGEWVSAQVNPAMLKLVREERWTRADVAAALA